MPVPLLQFGEFPVVYSAEKSHPQPDRRMESAAEFQKMRGEDVLPHTEPSVGPVVVQVLGKEVVGLVSMGELHGRYLRVNRRRPGTGAASLSSTRATLALRGPTPSHSKKGSTTEASPCTKPDTAPSSSLLTQPAR